VELVRQGIPHLADDGSFTLISGILARHPIRTGAVSSLANGGLEAFVRAAAIELPGRRRINAVSPTVFAEALDVYGDLFPGFLPVPVREVAASYVRSIEGAETGAGLRARQLSRSPAEPSVRTSGDLATHGGRLSPSSPASRLRP
jgi:NAD(P)-dependent dehydrogenase (short-subunit alcohol dehydrogenase family)